ncbi:MAG TPA: FkbM family methyltransferase [Phycisphaerae bacterium]|nr:FkbM family methyltransferase [Phycisphaerae bacterium]
MNFEFKVHDQTYRFPVALIQLQVPGLRYPVGLRPETSDSGAFAQVYLERDYQLTIVKPPRLIIDAGANIGLVSALFANQFPEAKILSVEPMAENFALLCENVGRYPNIKPLHAAVWNKSGTINLVTHDQNNQFLGHWGIQVRESPVTDPNSAVRAMTISEILEFSGLPVIDILKIDIEGAEVELFDRNAHLWLSKTNMLIIELHDRFKPGCSDAVYNAMKPFGFMTFKRAENTFFIRNIPL